MNFIAAIAGALIVCVIFYIAYRFFITFVHRPKSYPTPAYLQRMRQKYRTAVGMVCFGDSITQGDLGVNYVSILEKKTSPEALTLMNAGINGDLTCNLLARAKDVIAVQPFLITILIGTNDVHASMSPENYAGYVRMGKTNQPANFATFKENIDALISRLQSETAAHIALISIPLISENLTHEVNQRGDLYSDYLREAAERHKVDYLPLRETQKAFLQGKPPQTGQPYENSTNLIGAAFFYKSLGFGWDRIAAYHGNQLSIDNLHSNSITANMIADLIQGFIRKYTSNTI